MVQREHLQRVEGECESLRERVHALTVAEEKLKLQAQQNEFAKIKAEEEARTLKAEAT